MVDDIRKFDSSLISRSKMHMFKGRHMIVEADGLWCVQRYMYSTCTQDLFHWVPMIPVLVFVASVNPTQ